MQDEDNRDRLLALPSSARVLGDALPIRYEIADQEGIARIELREGQARRLMPDDLPRLDRPLRFAVVRGQRPAIEADTIDELRAQLRAPGHGGGKSRFKPPRRRRH
jgi:hypothetical protein